MCRIAGIFDPRSRTLGDDIRRMTDAMRRGGPDDEGVYLDPDRPLAMGHRRLSLIDIGPSGHQPMADADGELQIVFNGEIYNFRELRDALRGAGAVFATGSDTEVILKAYQQWGTDCFAKFNGMFALALLDRPHRRLVLARDHAGIKPLYYHLADDQLYFASEIRAFRALRGRFDENPSWKIPFLAFGHLPEPVTTLRGVQPVEAGQFLVVDLSGLAVTRRTFRRPCFSAELTDRGAIVPMVRASLEAAVRRHLISDAPIGLFLSGGIDSSALTLLAKPVLGDKLTTLSISFAEAGFSEKRYQDIIVRKIGGQHFDFEVSRRDFDAHMPDALTAMDQPTVDGLNSYFISRYARECGLKAVLAGHGGDELFGGYPSFRLAKYYRWSSSLPRWLWQTFDRLPSERWRKLSYRGRRGPIGEYLTYRGIFSERRIAGLLGTTVAEVASELDRLRPPIEVATLDDGNRASWIETNLYLRNQLLRDSDFMSMWHGLEIRVPFLDLELMTLLYRVDPAVKFGGPVTKRLLIDAMGQDLPEAIWNRQKQGFTFPFERWMRESAISEPVSATEKALFSDFRQGRLAWGRYWCALVASRFVQSTSGEGSW
jgi:asparagine synthase (glutamine-hydrolysing)